MHEAESMLIKGLHKKFRKSLWEILAINISNFFHLRMLILKTAFPFLSYSVDILHSVNVLEACLNAVMENTKENWYLQSKGCLETEE